MAVSTLLLAPKADGFPGKWVTAKGAAGSCLPSVVFIANEALSEELRECVLGFIILAACASPDVQEIAPRGDREA